MFEALLQLANSKIRKQESSGKIQCGQVSAAIESTTGKLYSGVCIDSACSLGMCAERNAIGSMVTEGEFHITKLVCVKDDDVLLPCGACCELLMQLHPNNADMQVLTDINGGSMTLNELLPHWWGK